MTTTTTTEPDFCPGCGENVDHDPQECLGADVVALLHRGYVVGDRDTRNETFYELSYSDDRIVRAVVEEQAVTEVHMLAGNGVCLWSVKCQNLPAPMLSAILEQAEELSEMGA